MKKAVNFDRFEAGEFAVNLFFFAALAITVFIVQSKVRRTLSRT
jgi:hypothetical protein